MANEQSAGNELQQAKLDAPASVESCQAAIEAAISPGANLITLDETCGHLPSAPLTPDMKGKNTLKLF